MRRLLVVVALLALMIGVETLQAPTPTSTHDPLTLATIGFVLLASFTLAESGAALRLPRVTGYILGGALLGPSIINLLDAGVVGEMRMFNTLALGLIAIRSRSARDSSWTCDRLPRSGAPWSRPLRSKSSS
jgi:hypothetical protein